MTSLFEGQSPKTSPFPTKTRGPIWVLRKTIVGIVDCTVNPLLKQVIIRSFRLRLSELKVQTPYKVGPC